ncbi:hypothetical protein UUU_03410 [Klebsiella pneumoniae subsp. pneumoniae DSM 30104 = JCM 1662 = NBRC 14940]|nr:hypothetical protein UUU_03410 [Klebsiella pneumoniae subsp. pneumoniae DSM 30104 = JCM 1662 = NBRC 14940]
MILLHLLIYSPTPKTYTSHMELKAKIRIRTNGYWSFFI